jgi:hypothetical protein
MLPLTYQITKITPSQWGAGGGSATHKEPTQAALSADSTQNQGYSKTAASSPPLSLASQCMSGQPIFHLPLTQVDLLIESTANQAI